MNYIVGWSDYRSHTLFLCYVKMLIKVFANKVNYKSVLDYYNSVKPVDEEPLERLDRFEGGFQIRIPEMADEKADENRKIRQVRWDRGFLRSWPYIGFTERQSILLYEALVHSYGTEGRVLLLADE